MFSRTCILTTVVAFSALGIGGGVLAPHAHAQGLNKTNNEAPDRASLGDKIRPNAPVVISLPRDGGYEAVKRASNGHSVTVQSKTRFGTIVDGGNLFVVTPDGNYLFTKTASGLLLLPGGYNVTTSGDVIDPSGKSSKLDKPVTTPQGITVSRSKDGATTLTLPDKSVFMLRDTMEKGMNPSGIFYD